MDKKEQLLRECPSMHIPRDFEYLGQERELLLCPFCGCKANVICKWLEGDGSSKMLHRSICCSNESCYLGDKDNFSVNVAEWNTRHTKPELVSLDEKAIKESLGYPTNRILSDKEILLIRYICDNFGIPKPCTCTEENV